MKRLFGICSALGIATIAFFVLAKNNPAEAQVAYENPGIDQGYNNDPYDVRGCVWRGDFKQDGTIDYHEEEKQAPDDFYIKPTSSSQGVDVNPNSDGTGVDISPTDTETCQAYGESKWQDLKKKGEAALWPIGCFNPINIYDPLFISFLGLPNWRFTWGSFEWNKNYDTWDEFYYIAMSAFNKRQDPPNIDLQVQTKSPSVGNETSLSAVPFRFNTPNNKLLYGWASQYKGKRFVSQQGLVAGGRELSEADVRDFSFPEDEKSNVDSCRRVTRNISNPKVNDADKDGMDDNWERRYAPNGDYANFKPGNDPDQDGVNLTDPSILNQENKPLLDSDKNPIPQTDVYNGIRVTPDTTADSAPGDGKFTNMEEYIWGTNPLDSDTDDDGFPDEADIVGLGQYAFTQKTEIDQNSNTPDRLTYRVTAVGISKLADELNSGHRKVMIDSDERTVIAGIESDLQASVYNVNQTPNSTVVTGTSQLNDGKDILVEADAFQSQGDKAVLDYTWYVEFRNAGSLKVSDRVQVPPTPEYTLEDAQKEVGRIGKYTFRHPVTELLKYVPSNYQFDNKSGSLIYITAEISNLVTHEFASKRIPISIGSDQSMALQITDLNTGETLAAEDYVVKYCHELESQNVVPPAFCAFSGRTLNQVLPWIVFAGSRVEVTAQPIQAESNNLIYEWYVNQEKVNEAYGPDTNDNKLVIYPESTAKTYDVVVKGFTKDQYRNEIFDGQISLAVEGPIVAITSSPQVPVTPEAVQLSGELLNFPESSVGGYTWTITGPDGNKQTQTGKEITLASPSAGTYQVTLDVDFQGTDNNPRTLTAQKNIVVGSSGTSTQAQIQKLFASMASIVGEKSAVLYKAALVGSVVLVGIMLFFGFLKFRTKK